MTRCWVKTAGTGEAAGPYDLAELRALRSAGLLTSATLISTDPYERFRALATWPELTAALNDPKAVTVKGETSLVLGTYVATRKAPAAPSPVGRASPLNLGAVRFDNVNAADKAGPKSALDALALNRAHEPIMSTPPSPPHRVPLVKDFGRALIFVVIGGLIARWGWGHMENPFVGVAVTALGGGIIGGGCWFVFFISPSRWDS